MSAGLANAQQRAASNPSVSAFVAASAGSGKTKLLTDRLLRLMLAGTRPERILCLTYTKAAAAEMAIRLNRRLGAWVVSSDKNLDAELAALDVPQTAASRAAARKMFADVLDLPGGMKIGTIHAFCQSLLRRFPLEARISPHFALEDEFEAASRLREARERALADIGQHRHIAALAAETDEKSFAEMIGGFAEDGELPALFREFSPAGVAAMQRAALVAPEIDLHAHLHGAVHWDRIPHLTDALRRIAAAGNPSGQKWALSALDWLALEIAPRVQKWGEWINAHFTLAGEPRKHSGIYGKPLASERERLHAEFEAEQTRVAAVEEARKAAQLAILNSALLGLAAPILDADSVQKSETARVTYADLIAITLGLLKNPEDVAWILYKLDGGIDHLLLDEVQDTAPAQWRIADAIAGDFFAGMGARDVERTIFAVGDPKQSIFSFQGADLQSFEDYRDKFRAKALGAETSWLDGELSVSFRSTAPVLELVDAVFAEGPACEGVGTKLTHGVSRAGQAGAITLWPLAQPAEAAPLPPWAVPDTYQAAESAKTVLARAIATHIADTLGSHLPSRSRAATPGDFLILVRKRDELVTAITKACKVLNIPIAGADRMVLTEQQAVSDLLALCDALLLPDDDLAFGQFLASPLGGLSDQSLMDLALGRSGSLAAALFGRRKERLEWLDANAFFQTLRAEVDFSSPYDLLSRALGPRGGRAKLLRRLGEQAAEPIGELLEEALAFARRAPASLQNFLFTLRQSGASIKREAEAGGDLVRVMTVHGAKGLQAPVVILPDTTSLPTPRETLFWLPVPQQNVTVPVFCPRTNLRSAAIKEAAEAAKTAGRAEYNRLLYVALTRAEDELIIAGAEGGKALPEDCWYNLVKQGFARLGVEADGDGLYARYAPQTAGPDREGAKTTPAIHKLPAWAGAAPGWQAAPPPAETTRPEPLAPSRATDDPAKAAIAASPLSGAGAYVQARADALAKGRAVHQLLQHLPDLAPGMRAAAAAKFLAQPGLALTPEASQAITQSVLAIIENPLLAPLFGPESRAEVPLAGVIGDVEIGGLVDRLAVTPTAILFADYKTDRAPPATPEAVPTAYLRQMAAYTAILTQIFPGRAIQCTLIFTETAAPMRIPAEILARHAPNPAQPYAA